MTRQTLTIGTRGSTLALWQANHVRDLLLATHSNLEVHIEVIRTKGDKILDVALSKIGDKGLFTKELERALIAGDVDVCVHSMKDMPTVLPEGLEIVCMPKRADVRDALVGFKGVTLNELPAGARIATGSLRRSAQIAAIHPHIVLCEIRGNVETRINKVRDGQFDATVLAVSGIERLGFDDVIIEKFSPTAIIPAVGQGAIGVEARADDVLTRALLLSIADKATLRDVAAERIIMRTLEGGCQVPMGAYARKISAEVSGNSACTTGDDYVIDAFVSTLDGSRVARVHATGYSNEADALAARVAEQLMEQGACEILEAIR